MGEILYTARLLLREMTQADYADLKDILMDPKVMYAYDHTFSEEEVQAWLARQLERYETDGFGLWGVVDKKSGAFLGQTGLTYQQCEGEQVLEVGYLFKHEHWHNGYATEAAQACKLYAKNTLGADALYAIINASNFASQKLALKLGMKVKKEFYKQYSYGLVKHLLFAVNLSEGKGEITNEDGEDNCGAYSKP